MDVDFLLTPTGDGAIICAQALPAPVAAAMLDNSSGFLSLEFKDGRDPFEMNIPVSLDYVKLLKNRVMIHVASLDRKRIDTVSLVPLMHQSIQLDDQEEYYDGPSYGALPPLIAWRELLPRVDRAQPLHRDNLGDESGAGGLMHRQGLNPAIVQLAPRLAQDLANEIALQRQMAPAAPNPNLTMAPPGLGPKGGSSPSMNLGLSRQSGPKPPTDQSNKS